MRRDPKELGNKLTSYADAIVSFAFVQGVTFSFTLGNNEGFLGHAVRVWWLVPIALVVANVFYAYMVYTCHSGETALLGPLETGAAVWEKKVRRWRFVGDWAWLVSFPRRLRRQPVRFLP
jgi:hypothetical protein